MVATEADTHSPPPALRGSEKRITDLMEAFQESYIRGVAAAAGCVIVGKPEIDEGIDVMLSHRADIHLKDKFAFLQIQMKATTEGLVEDGKFIRTQLRQDRYDLFRNDDPSIHRIVVVLHIPENQEDWLRVGDSALLLHHHAYWVSIEGKPASAAEKVTVKAPTDQLFDDLALCGIMARIGQGGAP
ncbi:conserved hypothetical protein [uncultured Mycobacterium sp.]|uniref:DUF4365 domain-containing protein n=1 Tax=uncultured Mycobacterium sp. TaxID=171292 RepID=A0A1Y5PHX1_9MYCO|nr:conserved hypothetical protein [uncultured Mycobacterium sp.]